MDANEFWCRAFLAEMNGTSSRTMVNWEHERAADRFEKAADAALSVAQRRGMVTGERAGQGSEIEALRSAGLRWLGALRANNVDAAEAAEQDLLRAAEALDRGHASAQPTAPKLERVEFTATSRGDMWELHGAELGSGIQVFAGRETYPMGGATVRIKWGETMPPKPIEVWIERR
jgi:hypothetical protein